MMAEYIDEDFILEVGEKRTKRNDRKKAVKEVKQSNQYNISAADFYDDETAESNEMTHSLYIEPAFEAGQLLDSSLSPMELLVQLDNSDIESVKADESEDHLEKDPNQSEPKNTEISDAGSDEETKEDTLNQQQHDQDKRVEAVFRNQRKISSRQDQMNERLTRIENHLISSAPILSGGQLTWPINSLETLQNYEAKLKNHEKGLENELKKKFSRAKQTSLEIFITENARKLLGSTGRWTWTGLPPNSSQAIGAQPPPSGAASGLLCVQVLIDYCEELFGVSNATVVAELKKAFKRINEAKKKYDRRHNADSGQQPPTKQLRLSNP